MEKNGEGDGEKGADEKEQEKRGDELEKGEMRRRRRGR